MGSGGTEFDPADATSSARLNQKSVFVGTGAQISGLATTYAGQLAFCTSTGSGFTIDKFYQRNAANSAWVETSIGFTEVSEANSTPISDNADFTAVAGTRYYGFVTIPSTEKIYVITGIEWKNGATVSGNVTAGLDVVDANPPTLASTPLIGVAQEVAQAGTSAVQRVSVNSSWIVRAGTIVGIWVSCSSGTATLREQTGLGSQNQSKATAYSATPNASENTAWATATARKYLKLYFRGYT